MQNKPKLHALADKAGNEIIIPPLYARDPVSERQYRRIPLYGPRTGTHPATSPEALSFINGLKQFYGYISALVLADNNAPSAFHSRIDGAIMGLEVSRD